jgi:hypothetical protein
MKINVDSVNRYVLHYGRREGAYLNIWKPVYRTDPPYTHSVGARGQVVKHIFA